MKKTLRRLKSGYVLSFVLWFLGLVALFWVFWVTWADVSVANSPLSTFWELLWNRTFNFVPGFEFKLVYLTVSALGTLVAGFIVFGFSREWFLLGGKNSLLECPWCKKRWRSSPDKALVHCPHCRQLVHPVQIDD
jgi:hypothetical protein